MVDNNPKLALHGEGGQGHEDAEEVGQRFDHGWSPLTKEPTAKVKGCHQLPSWGESISSNGVRLITCVSLTSCQSPCYQSTELP